MSKAAKVTRRSLIGGKTGAGRGLATSVVQRAIGTLKPYPDNPRKHPEVQIQALMRSMKRVWTNPILVDEDGTILAGHGRLEAAKRLSLAAVPTLTLRGLSSVEKRAIVIADNRLPERAIWDFDLLKEHLKKLIEVEFEIEQTGFSTGEVDLILDGRPAIKSTDPEDSFAELIGDGSAITRTGDLWELGRHRVFCGDALTIESYGRLLTGELAQLVVTDPPFNLPISYVGGRGKTKHREFKTASGEMSEAEFVRFLETFIRHVTTFSQNGSIHYIFMDWRHLSELLAAARPIYADWKNLLVWNKSNAGQGSFYRSQHELIAVFKNGTVPHANNFGLGATGRYRTNVLDYPSVNSFHPARRDDLAMHPTVKPIALIADLIRDCSSRNGIILDPFGGSGTTVLAAERTGRVARLIELDPIYVDVTVKRWEKTIGVQARHAETGLSFKQLEGRRGRRADPASRAAGSASGGKR